MSAVVRVRARLYGQPHSQGSSSCCQGKGGRQTSGAGSPEVPLQDFTAGSCEDPSGLWKFTPPASVSLPVPWDSRPPGGFGETLVAHTDHLASSQSVGPCGCGQDCAVSAHAQCPDLRLAHSRSAERICSDGVCGKGLEELGRSRNMTAALQSSLPPSPAALGLAQRGCPPTTTSLPRPLGTAHRSPAAPSHANSHSAFPMDRARHSQHHVVCCWYSPGTPHPASPPLGSSAISGKG